MNDHGCGRSPAGQSGTRALRGLPIAAALLFGACNGTTPQSSATEAPSSAGSTGPSARASDVASGAPLTGQTDTDWGRIWDDLPEAFPIYPGTTPADDASTEPVSGTFALEGAEARVVATWMQTELERAAYRTEALNGPFEDGSYILELIGSGDCRVEVAAGPLGGLVTVSVRYGAACPPP